MDLSIIIVNWNSIDFTRACIESLYSTVPDSELDLIVVDNASNDDCRELLNTFPKVKLVCSERNIGFARANNLGLQHSHCDTVLFLNPDTVVLDNAVQEMMRQLYSRPDLAAVGCRLLNRDLTLQTSCVQPFPTILNQLLSVDWLKRRWPALSLWGVRGPLSTGSAEIQEVDAVSGACIMVKRPMLESVGCFSTEYFMYAEEVDLCCKLRRAGWHVGHVSKAQVVHFGGQSTKQKDDSFANVVMRESVFMLLCKFRGTLYARMYRLSLLLSAFARLIALSPLLIFPEQREKTSVARRALNKWYNIAKWSLALDSGVR
jgi:N-acetylglucosaminyl-diphospho-decaprenol L-rhamnosyltransferase